MHKILTAILLTLAMTPSTYASKSAGEKKVQVIKANTILCQLEESPDLEYCDIQQP